MRDLYLDVNSVFREWSGKIIVGDPYRIGQCTFLDECNNLLNSSRYSDPDIYATKLLSKKGVE